MEDVEKVTITKIVNENTKEKLYVSGMSFKE